MLLLAVDLTLLLWICGMAFSPGKVLGDIDSNCRKGSDRGLVLSGEASWSHIVLYADRDADSAWLAVSNCTELSANS